MKKISRTKNDGSQDNAPFTSGEAQRMFGAIHEHFDEKFDVIKERIDFMDEKFERKFLEVHEKLGEHSSILGRLLIDVEEINLGILEKRLKAGNEFIN